MNKRPEVKVVAASGGGAIVAGLIVWGLGVLITHVPLDRGHEDIAVAAVPAVVVAAIFAAVSFALGYLAPRTSDAERTKPDPDAQHAPVVTALAHLDEPDA
ncbi:hypothetical protein ACPPVT_07415 [Angustibacter sp. McL0619]|uniref:hypothetical protein n=1 Tax=Angustibacter sp. McL0619 TaxID=3415676 RepID=UPI003CEAA072